MPELPEVETIARDLRPLVVARTITDAWFDWPNQIKHPTPSAFVAAVRGREIVAVERRAKWLIFSLGPGSAKGEPAVLAIQVKMTGQLDVVAPEVPRDPHVHAVFSLDDGRELRLRDTRKFGRLAVYAPADAQRVLGTLGPEPLGDELSLAEFRRMLRARRARLKTLLMNQEFLAGVGNIYADEALWRARLHPLRSAASLRADQARDLYVALRDVLNEAIDRRGSSVDSYRAPSGSGNMQHFLNIYGRTGKPCPRCGRPTRRMVIGARSTHFCSWCQRLPARDRSASTETNSGRRSLMAILRLSGIRREIGDLVILDSVNAAIAHGDKVGLVGPNGAGKTTLLRVAAGLDQPDSGEVHRKRSLKVGLLSQEANLDSKFMAAASLRAAVRSGAAELEEMEVRLREMESAGSSAVESDEYAHLREAFEARDGYTLDVRVDAALSGLGFAREDWTRPPTEMSGGQQTRAALARILVAELDLLMLDEPTNHLDLAAIEWLEAALATRREAVLVASHDRAFLDGVVARIWELRDRRLEAFRGNYSEYLGQREERDARARLEGDVTAGAIKRERELVQTYRSHRKFSKMHEHERRLAAVEEQAAAAPKQTRKPGLTLDGLARQGVTRSGDVALGLEEVVAGYPGRGVVQVERLEARRGTRIGLVGPNGSGKTTLLRTIAGELAPLGGYVRVGQRVQIGYLAQVRAQPLAGATVIEAMMNRGGLDAAPARSYLARFLFRGEDVFKPVDVLSGGERSRLELALVGLLAANLLLLDEPTNHLDIPAREALESFLRDAPGTVIVVSHDRRLLQAVCTELWVVGDSTDGSPAPVARFPGGFREWREAVGGGWTVEGALSGRRLAKETPVPAKAVAARSTRSGAARSATTRSGTTRITLSKDAYRRRRQVVEDDLTRLGLRKSQLELSLTDPRIQGNFVELRRVTSELADVDAALAQAEDAWLVLSEQAPR